MAQILNGIDDILIFSNYDTDKINYLQKLILQKCGTNNALFLFKIFNNFCEDIYKLELADNIIMNDITIQNTRIKVYLHRMVRILVEKYFWSKRSGENLQDYYNDVINMPELFIKYLEKNN